MLDTFQLVSPFQPTGDQPQAIEALANGLNLGLDEFLPCQTKPVAL